jgi:hypothetical protein
MSNINELLTIFEGIMCEGNFLFYTAKTQRRELLCAFAAARCINIIVYAEKSFSYSPYHTG